jgi:hypothetical protein
MITNKPTVGQRVRPCSGGRPFTPSFEGWRAVFPLMCVLIGFPSPSPAQGNQPQTELDVASYASELDRCAQSIEHPATIHQLRQSLPRSWRVRVGDKTVEVSTAWLAADLKKIDEDPAKTDSLSQEVSARLVVMRKQADGLEQGTTSVNFEAAHTQLDKILSGREFGSAQGPSQFELLKARIARWISDQIYKILRRLHLGAKAGNALAWTIVGIAFLALSFWVWKTSWPATRRQGALAEVASESNDPREWARDALRAADRGDYREAVHCAYWAADVHLETLGVLKRDRARTPRESLRLLDPHPTEQDLLREFTRRFELIWYGYRPASANDWSEARSNLEKMGCLTPSTPATANS